jgi:hypothetical protein
MQYDQGYQFGQAWADNAGRTDVDPKLLGNRILNGLAVSPVDDMERPAR